MDEENYVGSNSGLAVGPRASLAQRRAAQLPKLKDLKKPRADSFEESMSADGDLEFEYGDCDSSYKQELSELYTYSEIPDFQVNYEAFASYAFYSGTKFQTTMEGKRWTHLSDSEKQSLCVDLLNGLERTDPAERNGAVRSILYLLQGAWMDCNTEKEILWSGVENVYLLFELGAYPALCQVLYAEIQAAQEDEIRIAEQKEANKDVGGSNKDGAGGSSSNKPATGRPPWAQPSIKSKRANSVTIHDNQELRVVLASLYIMVETLRRESIGELGSSTAMTDQQLGRMKVIRNQFMEQIGAPIVGDAPLAVILFQMIIKFCSGTVSSYPMRKVLLLLWKVLLSWLGGWEYLRRAKQEARSKYNLTSVEDTLSIARNMRAAAPPPGPLLQGIGPYGTGIGGGGGDDSLRGCGQRSRPPLAKRQLACSNSGSQEDDDSSAVVGGSSTPAATTPMGNESDDDPSTDSDDRETITGGDENEDDDDKDSLLDDSDAESDVEGVTTPRPGSPNPGESSSSSATTNSSSRASSRSGTFPRPSMTIPLTKNLPWKPKIRPQEVEMYLEAARLKFLGFQLPGDSTTTAGLPLPIRESLKALNKHVYKSIGDIQIKREDELNRYHFSQKENIPENGAETLYRHLLPEMPTYMVSLLKVILSAQPSSRGKTEAMNILSDVITGDFVDTVFGGGGHGSMSEDQLPPNDEQGKPKLGEWLQMDIDVNRHKEVIVKAAASILLLLLKHFRVNHIYQYEHISQHLVFANCIPLILKFFDQNIHGYVQSRNELPQLNFPLIVTDGARADGQTVQLRILEELREQSNWNDSDTDEMYSDEDEEDFAVRCILQREHTEKLLDGRLPVECAEKRIDFFRDKMKWPPVFQNRYLSAAINLMRVLNKLVKWKPHRIDLMQKLKTFSVLKRTMKIPNRLFRFYVCKILRMLTQFLTREQRKKYMPVITTVTHSTRILDDWLQLKLERELDQKSFSGSETWLQVRIAMFHYRRYRYEYDPAALRGVHPDDCNIPAPAPMNSQMIPCPRGYFLWRNLFSAINLLRILNKLTKWKHARTMLLVVFKSAPILKRTLRVKQVLLQLYALKLLKMQAKHLGRQWRKTNMEIMSAIYSKVRHRLNDDWAFGNETQSKAFDFQAEESGLRNAIELFHFRRYGEPLNPAAAGSNNSAGNHQNAAANSSMPISGTDSTNQSGLSSTMRDPDFQQYDNNIVSVLGGEYELTERFKVNYQKWLETEVYRATIDWDQLLVMNRGSLEAGK